MEDFIQHILGTYGWAFYLLVLVWTFLEGETIVLIAGALASEGSAQISVWLLMSCAFVGSFCGDQTYYYIGRRYGTPLLKRWPSLGKRVDWAFRMVRDHEVLFILSFRFLYGVRNVSPFVIGMSGVGRVKFFFLNMIAAFVWANSFAWGGYFLGRALEEWLGEHKVMVLLGFLGFLVLFAIISATYKRWKSKKMARLAAVPDDENRPMEITKTGS